MSFEILVSRDKKEKKERSFYALRNLIITETLWLKHKRLFIGIGYKLNQEWNSGGLMHFRELQNEFTLRVHIVYIRVKHLIDLSAQWQFVFNTFTISLSINLNE